MLYLNVSIFAARESGPSTADAARMKAGALPPGVPLKQFVGATTGLLAPLRDPGSNCAEAQAPILDPATGGQHPQTRPAF